MTTDTSSGTPPGTSTSNSVTTPNPVSVSSTPWHANLDKDTQGWVQNKKFDALSVEQVIPELIKGWSGAEKFLGVPPDQIVRLPKDGDDKALDAVYSRLGRPADANGYDIKFPEGFNEASTGPLKSMFHKHGLNTKQAAGLVADLVAIETAEVQKANDTTANKRSGEESTLKSEWGAAYEKNSKVVEGVAQQFGMTKEQLSALSNTMGPAAAAKMLHKIGEALGEDKFVGGGGSSSFGGVKSPAAAAVEIQTLMNDQDFVTKLKAGNAEANARWTLLHKQKAGG